MSSIGRIFIVVNLVLSAAFLGWAGAVLAKSDEFKQKYEAEAKAHRDTKAALEGRLTKTEGERDETKQSLATVREEKGRFEGDVDRLQKELASAKDENAQLRGSVGSIDTKLGDFQQNLKQKDDRIAELDRERDKLREEREKATEAQLAAESEKNNAVDELRRSKETVGSLQESVTTLTKDLDKVKFQRDELVSRTGVSLDTVMAQPLIQARVFKVLQEAGLVALNVGSDDGVTRGFTFDVFNGANYKGRVTVETVDKKFCSARITLSRTGQTIAEGDRAATRL
ncbi:MAG: hypothetical protein L0323_12520 [Planctomycetes bacterium]|nr:hypothetical protein [Planctomycetota bacterium]